MFFDKYPEFIEEDIRKDRADFKVTSETMTKRCQAILPKQMIAGKKILDIGSALGARQAYCVRYYGHYPCDYPYYEPEVVYVPAPAPHRTVVIVGAPQAVSEVVDTVYVKDSSMKDTIKVIKH